MSREEIFTKLNEVFQDVFDDESIQINENTVADDIEGWDSIMNVTLVVSVEQCFKMKFSMGEISTLKNVGAMVDLIAVRIA